MEIFAFWLLLAIVGGVIASNKGRSFLGFFLVGLVFSPIVGILVALVAAPHQPSIDQEQIDSGEMKECPDCAELVKFRARICRFCQHEFTDNGNPKPADYDGSY